MATKPFNTGTQTAKNLYAGTLSGTSQVTLYTVGASKSCKVSTVTLCNVSANTVSATFCVVPSGGTAGAANAVVYVYTMAAGDTLSLTPYVGGAMLGEGDFISAQASVTAALTVIATGVEGS